MLRGLAAIAEETLARRVHAGHPRDGGTNGGFAYRTTGRPFPIRGMAMTLEASRAALGPGLRLGVLAAELDLAGAVVDARTAVAGVESQVAEEEVTAPVPHEEVVSALAPDGVALVTAPDLVVAIAGVDEVEATVALHDVWAIPPH